MAETEQVRRGRRMIHKGNHMGKDSDHARDSKTLALTLSWDLSRQGISFDSKRIPEAARLRVGSIAASGESGRPCGGFPAA